MTALSVSLRERVLCAASLIGQTYPFVALRRDTPR
jgi:hypothetical protein